jgi:drug/metabolite transporter (DMT)-like permease
MVEGSKRQRRNQPVAIGMVVISAIAIGIAPTFAKLAFSGSSGAYSVIVLRNLMMAAFLAAGLLSFKKSFRLPRKALVMSVAMGPVYVALSFGYLGAVAYIPVNLTILIYFLHPLLIGLVIRYLGHESVSGLSVLALCIAILGLTIAIGCKWADLNPVGVSLAFLSAISCTVMIVGNSITMRNIDAILVIFYMVLSAAVILGVAHLFYGRTLWPDNAVGWIGFFGVGVAYTVGVTLFFAAVPMLGAMRATMITNLEPIFGIIFAMLILGEHVSVLQAFGMSLVLFSIITMEIAGKR